MIDDVKLIIRYISLIIAPFNSGYNIRDCNLLMFEKYDEILQSLKMSCVMLIYSSYIASYFITACCNFCIFDKKCKSLVLIFFDLFIMIPSFHNLRI